MAATKVKFFDATELFAAQVLSDSYAESPEAWLPRSSRDDDPTGLFDATFEVTYAKGGAAVTGSFAMLITWIAPDDSEAVDVVLDASTMKLKDDPIEGPDVTDGVTHSYAYNVPIPRGYDRVKLSVIETGEAGNPGTLSATLRTARR